MKENIFVIKCGTETGTAFYVSEKYLLTALHVVSDFSDSATHAIIDKSGNQLDFKIKQVWEDFDLALLETDPDSEQGFYTLMNRRIRLKDCVMSFGYPDHSSCEGLSAEGKISQRLEGSCSDLRMIVDNVNPNYNYDGMSGSPVIYDDKVIGVVLEQSGNTINLVSLRNIVSDLRKYNIILSEEKDLSSVPESLKGIVNNCRPNYIAYHEIEECLVANEGLWYVVSGNPGSGKTTIAAGFEPENDAFEILGRYFFKVPNDSVSFAERRSVTYFIDWIESVFQNTTGVDVPNLTFEDKRKSVTKWLLGINNELQSKQKIGLLIIDGLDEVKGRVEDFLSLFSSLNIPNIKIILHCISQDILPGFVIESLPKNNMIGVKPLSNAICELYIKENSGDWEKPYTFIQSVANKSEGHPLYMNYLCRYIKQTFTAQTKENELTSWIDTLPSIGGNIESYYTAIWKSIASSKETIEVLSILSQIRTGVSEIELAEMMLPDTRYSLVLSLYNIRFLLKQYDSDRYEIYHSSFRIYIAEKLKVTIKATNDQIASYCKTNKEAVYSIENLLHHVVCGSDYCEGLKMCNQEWADNCALHDVSPDIILHDIRECLSYAVDNDRPLDVVRLMLLAQRIENRYDSILLENTETLTEIYLLMHKPAAAVKYLVRENALLLPTLNSLFYLQTFFELGFDEQAMILAEAIDGKIRQEMHNNSGSISTSSLMARGLLIVILEMAGYGTTDLDSYYNHLIKLYRASEGDDSRKAVMNILRSVSAFYLANRVRSGQTIDLKLHAERLGVKMNKEIISMISVVLTAYHDLDKCVVKRGKNDSYKDIISQIETILENNNFCFTQDELTKLIDALIYDSHNSSVIDNLVCSFKKSTLALNFRNVNGVDIDTDSLFVFYRDNVYQGYADKNDNYVSLPSSRGEWESYSEAIIRELAYLNGRILRKSAESKELSKEYERLSAIINHIDFSFKSRTGWQRSYLLPEELFHFVYDKIVELYRDFFPVNIDDLKSHIEKRCSSQLSLYIEGYCAALLKMAEKTSASSLNDFSLWLSDKVFDFIIYAVQNRSMRCSYFMKLALNYAMAGDLEKCDKVYKEILKSSMGPEWYKEAQLELLAGFNELNIKLTSEQSAHAAALYEEASGEMTFQRYVQQQKNEFVGTLAKCSSLSDAIEYYKFETLPDSDTIIRNAEDWKVDMPEIGDGYDLGANHLIEASAMHYLLAESNASPFVKYALSELFWDNDDKIHNDRGYVSLHASIIKELNSTQVKSVLIPRMADYYANEYDRNGEKMYLSDFEIADITDSIKDEFEAELKKNNVIWKRTLQNKESCVKEKSLFEKLMEMRDTKTILQNRKSEIVSPISCYWYSLSQFIKPLGSRMKDSTNDLFNIVADHFDINVSPSQSNFEKFKWMHGKREDENQNDLLSKFLIWFLVHPDYRIVMRAEEAIKWLVNYDQNIIKSLIDTIVTPSEIGIDIRASQMLKEVATINPNEVVKALKTDGIIAQLDAIDSFSVAHNMYEIGKMLKENNLYSALYDVFSVHFPIDVPEKGDVWFEPAQMMFVENKIERLNNLHVTGGKDFAEPYIKVVDELLKNNTITNLGKDCKYVRRSFYLNSVYNSRYQRTMIGIMDRVLYGKVCQSKSIDVYNILN